jgi:hypothetical protein
MGLNPALRALRAAVQWRVLTPSRDLWALERTRHSAHCNSLHAKNQTFAAKLNGRIQMVTLGNTGTLDFITAGVQKNTEDSSVSDTGSVSFLGEDSRRHLLSSVP